MSTRVYTYATNLPGHNPENEMKLLLLWRENWMRFGYTPIVLNEHVASQHELYEPFCRRIAELPSVNNAAYESACYLRWLAMCQVNGGLHCDHDLFCYEDFNFGRKPDKPISYQGHIPCLVYGSVRAYEAIVLGIMNYKVTVDDLYDGRPHVSDMYIFQRGGINYTSHNIVKSYGEQEWEKAPFVHYSNASLGNRKPRWQHIRNLRNWK